MESKISPNREFTIETYPNREEWLAARGIGGSDMATLLGVNRWDHPLPLWARKTGRMPEEITPERQLRMRKGSFMEPLLCDLAYERTGKEIWQPGRPKNRPQQIVMLRSREHPHMTYSPDALYCQDALKRWSRVQGIFEGKDTDSDYDYSDDNAEGVVRARAQVHQGFLVTGLDEALIGVLVKDREFRTFEEKRNEEVIKTILELGNEFNELLKGDEPPIWGNSVATDPEVFADMVKYAGKGELYMDDEETVRLVEEYLECRNTRLEASKAEKSIKAAIKAKILAATGFADEPAGIGAQVLLTTPAGKLRWAMRHRAGYSVEAYDYDELVRVKK